MQGIQAVQRGFRSRLLVVDRYLDGIGFFRSLSDGAIEDLREQLRHFAS